MILIANLTHLTQSRYNELSLAMRLYRHIKLLKRMGRGHAQSDIASTEPGSLALDCPACPQPGKNLPDDWMNVPPEML